MVQASQCPNESEFNYDDLHSKLPHVFTNNQDALLGSRFQLKTPYITTRDPQLCFGAIRNLLWPTAQDANEIVAMNGKTWKIDFELEHCSETKDLAKFIQGLGLNATSILKCKWNDWVSAIDENNVAHNIYWHDPSYSLEHAAEQLNRHKGFEVTTYQRPMRVCMGPPTNVSELYKLRFVRDPFHGIWKGSRDAGLAVRRRYKNNSSAIRTFKTTEDFLSKGQVENHGFLLVNDFRPISERRFANPSYVMATALEIAGLFRDINSQMCVDDIGVPKLFLYGHETLTNLHQCTKCDIAANDAEWFTKLHTLAPTSLKLNSSIGNDNQEYRIEYGTGSVVSGVCNNETLYTQIQHATRNSHFSCYSLSCVKTQKIQYFNTFQEVHTRTIDVVYKQMLKFGVLNFRHVSAMEFEAHVPTACDCCRTKNLCLQALACVLLVLDVICGNIKLVSTTINIARGKVLRTELVNVLFGLRCKHNWTCGVPNLVFDSVVADHVKPDVLVCYKSENLHMRDTRVLRLL